MTNAYRHPLSERYASREMEAVFAPAFRFGTWRRLWLALAQAQRELGLDVPEEAIAQMRRCLDDVDLEAAARYERRMRHDVMAHIHLFGDQAPAARGILHLGATSAFVGDNTDLIQHREALRLVRDRLVGVVADLSRFAERHRSLPTLAYTHFQPAQPTTVGKRATLWIQDFLLDLRDVEHRLSELRLRGVRGTTGTQASFLDLFDGDHAKVDALERRVCALLDFEGTYPVTGQTYPRKVDQALLAALAGVASSASKTAHDVRLLAHLREVEEPFERDQVGSSAMPYKRNPMRSERICALARHVIALAGSAAQTAATQWLERTLDDSAARRLAIPDAYMATDAVLTLIRNVTGGLAVNPGVVAANLAVHLPFMATERALMAATAAGGDRQEIHDAIRRHSLDAARSMAEGRDGELFVRLAADETIDATVEELEAFARPDDLVGRAPEQVDAFLEAHVRPTLARYGDPGPAGEVRV